jgi:hypothetical protein
MIYFFVSTNEIILIPHCGTLVLQKPGGAKQEESNAGWQVTYLSRLLINFY